MLKYLFEGSKVRKIASKLPVAMVDLYGEKESYFHVEVTDVYTEIIGMDDDFQFAIAMFCDQEDFKFLSEYGKFTATYAELRMKIGRYCFDGWPAFDFKALLQYSRDHLFGGGFSD